MAGFEDFEPVQTKQIASGQVRPAPAFSEFIDSLEMTESGGGKHLWNASTGATGPLQMTPIAVKDVGGDYSRAVEDHAYSRGLGVQYAQKLWKQYGADPALTAAAFHSGPTAVNKLLKQVPEGEDPAQWVVSQLGPEGRGHNEKVMGRFTGQLKYDSNKGRFTEANAGEIQIPQEVVPRSFTDFDMRGVGDSRNPDIPSGFNSETLKSTFTNTVSALKGIGGTVGILGDMFLGLPAMISGLAGNLGTTATAAAKGEDRKIAWQAGREANEYFKGPEWFSSPLGSLFKVLGQEELYTQSPGAKVMEEVSSLIKKAGHWAEKNTDGSVPAESVETFVDSLMIGAAPLGARLVKGIRDIRNGKPAEDVAAEFGARKPRKNTEVVDAEIVSENKGNQLSAPPTAKRPSFRDFEDTAIADDFIKQVLKEDVVEGKKSAATKIAVGGAIGLAGGLAYDAYRRYHDNKIHEVPEPEEGNEIAKGKTVTGDEYDKLLNQFGSLAAIPFAIGAVKGKGGMWHPEAVERLAEPLSSRLTPPNYFATIEEGILKEHPEYVRSILPNGRPNLTAEGAQVLVAAQKNAPLLQWADRAVRNYLNKHAGTEGDPLKDVEIPVGDHMTRWEEITDSLIRAGKVKHFVDKYSGDVKPEFEHFKKAPPDEAVWRVIDAGEPHDDYSAVPKQHALTSYLSHVGDFLRQNVDPTKLQQYDLVRAVKETAANDARVAKEMENAASASMKDLPVYKEYPDGMKWVELKLPEKLTAEQAKGIRPVAHANEFEYGDAGSHVALGSDGKPIKNTYTGSHATGKSPEEAHLAGQLAQEGNQMGHCVGGYCEGVASGESRIFSLRDKKGKSHVTIEVQPKQSMDYIHEGVNSHSMSDDGYIAHLKEILDAKGIKYKDSKVATEFFELNKDILTDTTRPSEQDILQIKGKQNRAPVAEYLPYVQDFVKSGKWGDVGDLGNTGLHDLSKLKEQGYFQKTIDRLIGEGNRFATKEDITGAATRDGAYLPRNQRGQADIRLVKALALAGIGATVGASLLPDDRLTAGLVGGLLALGLGNAKLSSMPQLIAPGSKIARNASRGIEASVQQFIRNVNPDLMGKQAESAASVLGKNYTEMMQRQLAIEIPSQKRSEFWFRQGDTKSRNFLKAMEKGATFTDPTFQAYATAYRTWMNKIYKQDEAGGIKYDPIDNYVYHAFEDPEGAAAYFTKKYGAKWGDPAFTKDRTFDLIEEAEQAGFKLKTSNPESLMVMRQHASDIASMKVQALRDLAEYGLARKIEKGKPAASDEAVWRSPNGELYALPDQTNQVMHNAFNTKSLWTDPGAGGQIFRALSYAKNTIVPINLFGLFHPLHVQLGMSFADPLVAMTKRVAGGTASFTDFMKEALTKATLTDIISTPRSGWRTLQAFRGEVPFNKLTAMDKQNLNLMLEGTFNPIMPVEYRNQHMKDFRKAVLENSVTSLWHLPWAVLEKFYTKPIFEEWIPSVKTAAYLRGAYAALEANPELINQPLERMNALRKISKMVDDRFGEVAYKTLFMNRMVKDVAVASFLSYGWQLGFVRSYLGAVPEAVKATVDKGTLREKIAKGDLDKSMFVGYYIAGTMMYAGLLTYALTGELPKDIMDYIYPRTGEKNPDGSEARVGTPFYTREFVSIPKHIQEEGVMKGTASTIGNKLSPAIGMLKAMITNKDFFNREISDPNAPMMDRLGQRLQYAFKSMEPISISGAEKGPPGTKTKALSVLGFTPAPKYITDTPIEQKIKHEYGKYHNSVIPYAQGKRMEDRSELYRLKQIGEDAKFEEKLEHMQEKYGMTSAQIKQLRNNAEIPAAERLFGQLPNKTQEKLLNEMSTEEQERFRPRAGKLLRYQ